MNELTDWTDVTANLVIGVPSFAFKDTTDPIALQQVAAQLSTVLPAGRSLQMHVERDRDPGGTDASQNAPAAPAGAGPRARRPRIDEERGPLRLHGQARDDEEGGAAGGRGRRVHGSVCRRLLAGSPVHAAAGDPVQQPQHPAGGRAVAAAQRAAGRAQGPLHEQEQLSADDGACAGRARRPRAGAGADYVHRGQREQRSGDHESRGHPGQEVGCGNSPRPECGAVAGQPVRAGGSGRHDQADQLPGQGCRHRSDQTRARQRHRRRQRRRRHQGQRVRGRQLRGGRIRRAGGAGTSWPNWWPHFNGVGRIEWKIRLEPGKTVDLGYTWHYFWR